MGEIKPSPRDHSGCESGVMSLKPKTADYLTTRTHNSKLTTQNPVAWIAHDFALKLGCKHARHIMISVLAEKLTVV
jgi:hypothetical protein